MEWIEVRGRTMAEAIERALDALGVHQSELDYEVVSEPKSALFGLKRTEAHIRARVAPLSREKPTDRRRRRSAGGRDRDRKPGGGNRGRGSGTGAATTSRSDAPAPERSAADRPQPDDDRGSAPAPTGSPSAATPGVVARGHHDATPEESGSSRRRRSRGGRNRSRPSRSPAPADAEAPTMPTEEHEMPDAQQLELAESRTRDFVEGLLDALDVDGEVEIEVSDAAVEANIAGENLGALVGSQGATLGALEELLRDSIGHQVPGVRLHLDVAGYRARRRAALAEFAVRVAREVALSGSAKALEPMPAADRKVVHDALSEMDGVLTASDGEEPRRRVIIKPAV